ncbi:MAG: ABC transporter permease, partial [Rhizobiales bacterium]|nr:ABC transporter permease [Hyphomicrobiales bacterium]
MSAAAAPARRASSGDYMPAAVGIGALALFFLILEALIQSGVINRFIMPPPSEVFGSFYRVIVEEDIFHRFLLTLSECLTAGVMLTVFGVSGGVLMHRFKLLQQACETWVAAMASAPIVLMYPLFLVIFGRNALTIIMMGFVAALPPVILKTIEGIAGTRKVLVN